MDLNAARGIASRLGYRMASREECEVLRSALEPAIRADLPLARHVFVLLAEFDTFSGRTAPARTLAARGLTLCPLEEAPTEHLRLLFARALCAYQDDDQVAAMSLFSVNRSRAHMVGDLQAAARATMGLAMCIVDLGDPKGSLQLLDDSQYLMDEATPGVALSLRRARVLALIGLERFHEAAALLHSTDMSLATPRDHSLFHLAAALTAIEVGDSPSCRQHLDQVERSHLGLAADEATYFLAECLYRIERGEEDRALHAIDEVLRVARVSAVRKLGARALRLRARILCDRGELDAMWKALDESHALLSSATVETVGSAVHAVVGPVLEEIDHLRSVELKQSNDALTDAVASLTEANERLADEVSRHRETQQELTSMHQELVRAAHLAGMAEVATGILHDLGNALNSVGTSVDVAYRHVSHLPHDPLARIADGLASGAVQPDRAAQYLSRLQAVQREFVVRLQGELERVQHGLKHAARIIAAQQRNAVGPSGLESISVRELVDDAVELVLTLSTNIRVTIDVDPREYVVTAPLRVVRILVNLLKNARDALNTCPDAWLEVRLVSADDDAVALHIVDGGPGIPHESRDAVFRHGFTTKSNGYGFGLHASATSARELGGALSLEPSRRAEGARFQLVLPRCAPGKRLDILSSTG